MQRPAQAMVFQTSYGWTMNPISPAIPPAPMPAARPYPKLRLRRRRDDQRLDHPGQRLARSPDVR